MAFRDVVTVAGADARRYLQSQLAQDIDAVGVGESRWTLVLAPAGRVDALARIHRTGEDAYELDTDPGFGEALAARLARFKIRVDADIASSARDVDPDGLVGWWDRPTTDEGEDARVAAGWPAMGAEIIPGETIPAEIGISAVAVSFTKGCYPGQELVERMDSRGATPPRQLRVLDVGPGVAVGDPILDASGAEVGTYTSVAAGKALGYVRRGAALTSEV